VIAVGGRRTRNGGFTLVEVLLASVLLAILIIGIGFFFGYIIKQSDVMDDRTRALELSRQGLEEIRTLDISTMPDGTTGPVTFEKFSRYMLISTPYSTLSEARLVQSMVVWDGAQGPDTLTLSTIL
jgi:prepilin-type N-terminal cleavage/methylation domain-containing protein